MTEPDPRLVHTIRLALFPKLMHPDDVDYHNRYISAVLMLAPVLETARKVLDRD